VFDIRDPLLRDGVATPAFNPLAELGLRQPQLLTAASDELTKTLQLFVPLTRDH
jgi:hypothetical protein